MRDGHWHEAERWNDRRHDNGSEPLDRAAGYRVPDDVTRFKSRLDTGHHDQSVEDRDPRQGDKADGG